MAGGKDRLNDLLKILLGYRLKPMALTEWDLRQANNQVWLRKESWEYQKMWQLDLGQDQEVEEYSVVTIYGGMFWTPHRLYIT